MCNAKEKKKQKILKAAYELFVKNGYKSTKIIDIAKEAGIGKGTVYEYFDSKESLLLSIFSSGLEEYLVKCQSVLDFEGTQTEKILNLIELESKYSEECGARMMKMSQLILDSNDGMPLNFIKKMQGLWEKRYVFINKILVDGIENGEFRKMNTDLATVVVMGATGTYLNVKCKAGGIADMELPFDVDSFNKQELIDFILRGIQA